MSTHNVFSLRNKDINNFWLKKKALYLELNQLYICSQVIVFFFLISFSVATSTAID